MVCPTLHAALACGAGVELARLPVTAASCSIAPTYLVPTVPAYTYLHLPTPTYTNTYLHKHLFYTYTYLHLHLSYPYPTPKPAVTPAPTLLRCRAHVWRWCAGSHPHICHLALRCAALLTSARPLSRPRIRSLCCGCGLFSASSASAARSNLPRSPRRSCCPRCRGRR